MESTSGKLDPNYLLNPTSLPSDSGDEVFAYDAEGRRFETRDAEETRRAIIDHRNPTGYSQNLDEIKRDADAQSTPAEGWEIERGYTIGLDVIAQARVEGSHLPELFLYDTHGSVRGLLDLQGKTRETYDYDAFGVAGQFYTLMVNPTQASDRSPIPLTQADAKSHLQYAGEFRTHSLGAYDLRARDYDASTGRFRSQDPTIFGPGDTTDANLFLYGSANPVYYTDPSGRISVYAGVFVGVGVLAVAGGLTGYFTKSSGSFLEGFVPGWGAGRGLGMSIREGDGFGVLMNSLFLALDMLTFGGASMASGLAKIGVTKVVSREAIEALYRKIIRVADDPRFIERAQMAGFRQGEISQLATKVHSYFVSSRIGVSASRGSSVTDEMFALTESHADDWTKIAHELSHVLDEIRSPGLMTAERLGKVSNLKQLQVEYRAFTIQYGSKLTGLRMSALQTFFKLSAASGAVNVPIGVFTTISKMATWWEGRD